MTTIASYQSVFRVAKVDGSNGYGRRTVKRNRPMVSCTSCRARKLKCDRQQPCSSCQKRSEGDECSYGGQSGKPVQHGRTLKTSEAQARLQKLEQMVASFVGRGSDQDGTTSLMRGVTLGELRDPSNPVEPDAPESERKAGVDTKYSGPTHWTKVLEDVSTANNGVGVAHENQIREIQGVLDEDDHEPEEEQPLLYPDGPSIIIEDMTQRLTVLDLSSSLPAKEIVDTLISDYVSKTHSAVMHTKKFMREYEMFWSDMSSVSFLWLSLLFSTCYVGACAHLSNTEGRESKLEGPAPAVYLKRAGQALQAGKFHKGGPYAVEAVLMYGIAKYIQKKDDPDTDAWLVMGLATRVAMRAGYHRDPTQLRQRLTPFEAEMRRRVFHTVASFDLLLSYQAGLPAILSDEQIDCGVPANLLDSDFDEDSTTLPPSRPPTDNTPMLYFVTKFGWTSILQRIMRHALQPLRPDYTVTLQLDAELRAYHDRVPPALRIRPLRSCGGDPIYVVLNRLNLEISYLKNVVFLHRMHISGAARADPYTATSRVACIDAALAILTLQADLNAMCAPGQPFDNHRWVLTSLTMHDFLMAAMVLCLDLVEHTRETALDGPVAAEEYARKHSALRTALDIWNSRRAFSREARRASDVLGIMLGKLPAPSVQSSATSESEPSLDTDTDITAPESSLDRLFSESEIDWDQFDRCLQGNVGEPESFPFGLDWQALDGVVAQDLADEVANGANSLDGRESNGHGTHDEGTVTMTNAMVGSGAIPVHAKGNGGIAF